MSGNTAFITYILVPSGITGGSYSEAIHCNYIKKINLNTSTPLIQEIRFNFSDANDFKFLANTYTGTTGYSANKIYAIVQLVDNTPYNTFDNIVPDSTAWKKYDITPQVSGYSSSNTWVLNGINLTKQVFKIPFLLYSGYTSYNLDYINYPSSSQTDELVFGDATYFFGNVAATIKADVYTTDISINLPLNEFNSTSNLTWNGNETVYISEIGIYDSNKNLVAIGKLNDPVAKDATIARTIVFALDF